MAFKKILAIKLRSLGDTILMTAPLQELHKAYPHAQIDVAVLTPWAPLLENLPGVKKVWPYDRHRNPASRAKAAARLAYKLRREHYDCVVNFHASPSSAMIAFATGAKTRSIHFHGHKDPNRYSTVVVPGKGVLKPIIERDMDSVRALGLKIPEGAMPGVKSNSEEQKWANQLVSVFGHGGPVLAMGIGASRPTKSWAIENFAKLAIEWCREKKGAVIALAAESEAALASAFLIAVDDILSITVTDIEESIEIRKESFCVPRRGFRFRRKRFRPETSGGGQWNSERFAFWTRRPLRVASLSSGTASLLLPRGFDVSKRRPTRNAALVWSRCLHKGTAPLYAGS
jgi:ADP-heptose:LPS heptosyltransferase